MKQRIITGLLMITLLSGIIFFIPRLFLPLITIVLGISIWEWYRICQLSTKNGALVAIFTIFLWIISCIYASFLSFLLILSAFHYLYAIRLIFKYETTENYRIHKQHLCWFGPIILATLAASLIYIFHPAGEIFTNDDAQSLLFIIMVIAAADSGAYFAGRFLGKRKLSPRVSPKKTIEGLLGGLVSVSVIVIIFHNMVSGWHLPLYQLWFISIIASLFSVIGDLFISIIKRQNGIKDTSQILPGHGGILDRADGLLAGIPVFYLLQQFA